MILASFTTGLDNIIHTVTTLALGAVAVLCLSFAAIRFEMVMRFSMNRPLLVFAQMCVNPR